MSAEYRLSTQNQALTVKVIALAKPLCYEVTTIISSQVVGTQVMKIHIALLSAVAATLVAGATFACGDSLYRVGKGVSYRVYTAPLPGSVLVYGEGEGAELLAKELARSGHGVRLVSNDEELEAEIGSGAYDVVIAAYSDRSAVAKDANAVANAPTFLPVALTKEEEAQALAEHKRVMVAEKDEIKHYLKAIHQTLKQRG